MKGKIGLLGGIGPEATGVFYLKLIERFQKEGMISSNKDFPQILINSIPAPELIHEEISDEELLPYIEGLRELEALQVDFIVMVCNTIHNYHNVLQNKIKTPILDLRLEFGAFVLREGISSMVLLGTPSTVKGDLLRVDGINQYKLNVEEMAVLSGAIHNFNSGIDKEKQSAIVEAMARKYLNQGAETVVLCCTEISLMLKNAKIKKIDTMDVLIEAIIKRLKG